MLLVNLCVCNCVCECVRVCLPKVLINHQLLLPPPNPPLPGSFTWIMHMTSLVRGAPPSSHPLIPAVAVVTKIRHDCEVQYGPSGPFSGQASSRAGMDEDLEVLWACRSPVHWYYCTHAGAWWEIFISLQLSLLPWGLKQWRRSTDSVSIWCEIWGAVMMPD